MGLVALTPIGSASGEDRGAALAAKIQPLIDAHAGQVAVAITHLPSGVSYRYRADVPMPTASLIKFPVMISAYKKIEAGKLSPETPLTLTAEDKVPGSGILTNQFSPGLRLSLRDAIRLMICFSDNTATNLVVDQVGLAQVADDMAALGCPETRIHSKVYRGDTSIFPDRSQKYGLGSTTADDMVKLYSLLIREELVSQAASAAMLDHLRACEDRTKIARFLPAGVKVAHKTGEVSASRTDAGVIESAAGPIVICVLTTNNKDQSTRDENPAHLLCAEIGRIAYEHFPPPATEPTAATGPMRIGASGLMVEALQRTLNLRLEPSPRLSVDGDFGGMTQAAVRAFQQQHKLPVTGEVDEATWEALGTLVTEDEPSPDPEVVNKERPRRENRDELEGRPFVTAKGWAIADAATGEFLWGDHAELPLDNASTTKLMTALVVSRLAAKDPLLWDQEVVFSTAADETEGSTAGVRAGERLPVSELIYGLMLPSGNDAAQALAEHFGGWILEHGSGGDENSAPSGGTPTDAFVRAMNATAKEVGLLESTFKNPHGLTAEGHRMSARDLTRLGYLVLKDPRIAECARTAQHGYRITGPGGYTRNLLWKNTNQLLGIHGYDGIKTGTTDAAGACLVARGWRDGQGLIIAILGAESSGGRYVDARNLFRWGFQQLRHATRPSASNRGEIKVTEAAERLHRSALVVDGHNDLPWNIREHSGSKFEKFDIAKSQPDLHTDIPRLRTGGLDVQFWSVWVPSATAYDGTALQTTLEQIDIVHAMIAKYPDTFGLALNADDIDRITSQGKIASLIGMEGGHSIENSLNVLHRLYDRGARYMTLTHADSLDWADSATDKQRSGGLSPFGEEVVREMNRLGMLVDISHVSVDCMRDTLDVTKAPVIFSHSSARAVADHPRNVPDEILRRMPDNGGVVMVNFYSGFVVPEAARLGNEYNKLRMELREKFAKTPETMRTLLQQFDTTHPSPAGTIHDVLDHIDHIAKVAGAAHVGLGSDFDGIPTVPSQLEDVSHYPRITQGLLDRGYSEDQIRGILGGNLMRVMRKAEQVARELAAKEGPAPSTTPSVEATR